MGLGQPLDAFLNDAVLWPLVRTFRRRIFSILVPGLVAAAIYGLFHGLQRHWDCEAPFLCAPSAVRAGLYRRDPGSDFYP